MFRRLDDTNKVLSRYFIFVVAIGLVLPDVGIVRTLSVDASQIPFYKWIAAVDGVLSFYADYFLVMLAALPCWLLVFGRVYAKNYSSKNVSVPILVPASLILLILVIMIFASDADISGGTGQRWEVMLVLAARSRVMGSLLFGGILLFVFVLLSISVVKMPIDVARQTISKS